MTSFWSTDVVAAHQVGVARVVVDDHLVDLRQAVVVALARAPRTPCRTTSAGSASGTRRRRRSRSELVGVDHLEDRLVEVEAVGAGVPLDLLLEGAQVGGEVGCRSRMGARAVMAGTQASSPRSQRVTIELRTTPRRTCESGAHGSIASASGRDRRHRVGRSRLHVDRLSSACPCPGTP